MPTDAQVANRQFRFVSDDDAQRFLAFVHNNDYLKNHQGEYAEAYSAYSPWVHRLDFGYKHDFCLNIGNTSHDLQLSFDMKNVLNFFSSSWGVSKIANLDYSTTPTNGAQYSSILKYEGLDADGYATYSTPSSINGDTKVWQSYHNIGQCWYASVGVKYMFEGKKRDDCGCDKAGIEKTVYVKDTKEIERLNGEINRLRGQVNDLQNRKPETKEKVITKESIVTYPYYVNFELNQAEVVNREKVNLKNVAAMIKASNGKKFSVVGFADQATGTSEGNASLAQNRAKSVYDVLINEFGVPASCLVLDSKGGVGNMYYNDNELSRAVIISEVK